MNAFRLALIIIVPTLIILHWWRDWKQKEGMKIKSYCCLSQSKTVGIYLNGRWTREWQIMHFIIYNMFIIFTLGTKKKERIKSNIFKWPDRWIITSIHGDRGPTFLCSLVVTVLKGARPPGAPRRHLAVDGTGDLAELGPVGDRTLTQLVFHRAGGCAYDQKGKRTKQRIKRSLLYFDLIPVRRYARNFFILPALRSKGTSKCFFTFIPSMRVPKVWKPISVSKRKK